MTMAPPPWEGSHMTKAPRKALLDEVEFLDCLKRVVLVVVSDIGDVHPAHSGEGERDQKATFLWEQGQRVTHNHVTHFGLRGWTLTMHTQWCIEKTCVCMCVCTCVCMYICMSVYVCIHKWGLTMHSTAQVSALCTSPLYLPLCLPIRDTSPLHLPLCLPIRDTSPLHLPKEPCFTTVHSTASPGV